MPAKIQMQPGVIYHLFNRGNNRQIIFKECDNYRYFLELAKRHAAPVAEIFAYALLPDHFHFILKIKSEEELKAVGVTTPKQLSNKLGNWFNAYAKAFNKRYLQVSSLFEDRFERIAIESEFYLSNLIYYVHSNPQKHKLVEHFEDWDYTSYHVYCNRIASDMISKQPIIDWFGGYEMFVQFHSAKYQNQLLLED